MKNCHTYVKTTAIVEVTHSGGIARLLAREMADSRVIALDDVAAWWRERRATGFVFVAAMGICVRTIAPLIDNKEVDPAVVCVDAMGRNVVSVTAGHEGGANALTRRVAQIVGAHAVVTTLSDCKGTWALDTLQREWGWEALVVGNKNSIISLFVEGRSTALLVEARDRGTDWMGAHLPGNVTVVETAAAITAGDYAIAVVVSPFVHGDIAVPYVQYIPKTVVLGVGLAHAAGPPGRVCREITGALRSGGIYPEAVGAIATIDKKSGEPALQTIAGMTGAEITYYTAEELSRVAVPDASETVRRLMGTGSVSEAAALLASGGELIMPKRKGADWTVAAAMRKRERGRVDFVGAGPGDPELLTLRGRRLLENADLILYAGSLVPRELTRCAKDGAVVRSSAAMTLEEQTALMGDCCRRGLSVVRLHTGDPSLYGAIGEQMARLDAMGIPYAITPGVSAFQAAAAALTSQFTIPGKTQTVILTRGEGRTPVPPTEKLHLLARSRSTMCIYLSADIVEDVERELLMEYPGETPVAVCYRLTWKEQQIWVTTLGNLAATVRHNHLTLDTLIVVGDAIGNRQGASRLYSSRFTHLYRKS